MDNSLFEYITQHMTKTTYTIDDFLYHLPGTPEEKESAYNVLIQYYEAIVEHLNASEKMNYASRTLYDIREEERKKNKQLPGFDSIRPSYTNKSVYGPCPCGGTNMYDPLVILTSMPAQYKLVCNKCWKITYVIVN